MVQILDVRQNPDYSMAIQQLLGCHTGVYNRLVDSVYGWGDDCPEFPDNFIHIHQLISTKNNSSNNDILENGLVLLLKSTKRQGIIVYDEDTFFINPETSELAKVRGLEALQKMQEQFMEIE